MLSNYTECAENARPRALVSVCSLASHYPNRGKALLLFGSSSSVTSEARNPLLERCCFKKGWSMAISDERLDQLANDPMMCNISPETKDALRELIRTRVRLRAEGAMNALNLAGNRIEELKQKIRVLEEELALTKSEREIYLSKVRSYEESEWSLMRSENARKTLLLDSTPFDESEES